VNVFSVGDEFNTSTIVLPFVVADLGLTADENPDFRYHVSVRFPDEDNERPPDDDAAPGAGSFDAFTPPVQTGQSLDVAPNGDVQWISTVDHDGLDAHPVLGWLIVYPTNETGAASADLAPLIRIPAG
jgi:hypothetical protein